MKNSAISFSIAKRGRKTKVADAERMREVGGGAGFCFPISSEVTDRTGTRTFRWYFRARSFILYRINGVFWKRSFIAFVMTVSATKATPTSDGRVGIRKLELY